MAAVLKDIIVDYVEDALDIDDLENIGDYVRSLLKVEGFSELQMNDAIRQLHADLSAEVDGEQDTVRKIRLKAALSYFEADFLEYIIAVEVDQRPVKPRR